MLYSFLKKDNNVVLVGDIDAATLQAKVDSDYTPNGFVPAEATEYFAQSLGVLNKRVEELEAELAALRPTEEAAPAA